jgi:SAM-dependent methyltransferase
MDELQPITDYTTYNDRMSLAMIDKLFFADKISPDLVIDFGCADGTLLRHLKALKPELNVIGYDADPKMVKHSTKDIHITSDWKNDINVSVGCYHSSALILSSVIHEICHYGSKADIDSFWKKVFETGFEYIVIRDMVPSRSIDRPSNVNDVKKVYHKFLHTKALNDFESVWGSIESNRQLVHFLLKYRYLEPNWDREVRENYLPLTREDLLAKIPNQYDVIFHEHYVLPYILQTVKNETGIEVKDPTHMKLILKKNGEA